MLSGHGSGRFREVLVDTGALSDRAVAERAGIGWVGKNTVLITEEFGSWVYLGEMITDVYLPPDTPVTEGCGDCTACLDACPTGALVQPGQLNAQACLSYLTQTKDCAGALPGKDRQPAVRLRHLPGGVSLKTGR